jgi:two-component system NtrC family response regulator
MERAYILSGGGPITAEHLPNLVRRPTAAAAVASAADSAPRTLEEVELDHLTRVLEKHNGSKTAAAAELGISLKTIYNKLNLLAKRKAAG